MAIYFLLFLVVIYFILKLIWDQSGSDAPFVPTDADVVKRVMDLAEVGEKDVFVDLGSGDGRMVVAAAMRGARAVGVESNWFKVLYSRLVIKILGLTDLAKIISTNIFDHDLSGATVVNLYLLQETNDKIQTKLENELKKGTKVVSVAFEFKNWKPIRVEKKGVIYGPLRLYKV